MSKSGGFTGNLAKLGGSGKKLNLKSDMKGAGMQATAKKVGGKSAHKKV
jgi:hypothetical protein